MGLLPGERGEAERAKGDDLATRREEEFLRLALLRRRQQLEAAQAAAARAPQGVCGNCGARCMAAYCDDDCRDDAQARQGIQARQQGRGAGVVR